MLIIITGPESSGKTTLATALSNHYKGTLIHEYSREYLHNLNKPYSLQDLHQIASQQYNSILKALSDNSKHHFVDTDWINVSIWAELKFGTSKEEFEKYTLLPDLYLICCPDLPWEFDPLRENPHELELLFLLHYQKVLESKTAYCLIQGVGTKRINQAINAIESHRIS
ncbi:MAG TPA: ATP-binding protein [Saprospiraceae bacterium]|nr:ATP-binding protein [Saprospiraceae bacterium]